MGLRGGTGFFPATPSRLPRSQAAVRTCSARLRARTGPVGGGESRRVCVLRHCYGGGRRGWGERPEAKILVTTSKCPARNVTGKVSA